MGWDEAVVEFAGGPDQVQKGTERRLAALRQAVADACIDETWGRLTRLYPASFIEAVDRTRLCVEEAEVTADPWPHMIADDLFPPAFWALLLDNVPPRACFQPLRGKKADLDLTDSYGAFRFAPVAARAVWTFAQDVLVRSVLLPALVAKWRPQLARKYAALIGTDCSGLRYMTANDRLMLRMRGYVLHPHLDSARLGLTCLIYLTGSSDEDPQIGTDLYSGDPMPREVWNSTTYAHKHRIDVRKCGTVAFRPNRLLVFLNEQNAHHGTAVPDLPKYDAGRLVWQFHVVPLVTEHEYPAASNGVGVENIAS
jgi:hypothetical protein